MSSKSLINAYGKRIGSIETDFRGVQILRNEYGRRLGSYDPMTNKTRTDTGSIVGTGNLLSTLLVTNNN